MVGDPVSSCLGRAKGAKVKYACTVEFAKMRCEDELGVRKPTWNTVWGSMCISQGQQSSAGVYNSFSLVTRSYAVAVDVALQVKAPGWLASCQVPRATFCILVLPQMPGILGTLYSFSHLYHFSLIPVMASPLFTYSPNLLCALNCIPSGPHLCFLVVWRKTVLHCTGVHCFPYQSGTFCLIFLPW